LYDTESGRRDFRIKRPALAALKNVANARGKAVSTCKTEKVALDVLHVTVAYLQRVRNFANRF